MSSVAGANQAVKVDGPERPAVAPAPARARHEHLVQIDLLRIVAIVAVVGTHVVLFTQPSQEIGANALTVLLHVSRFAFFFITAFVLYLQYGGRPMRVLRFWRKRFPPVLLPYVVWTVLYWQYNRFFPWGGYPDTLGAALYQLGENLLGGWFQLYFLIVTFQLYIAFPLIGWIVRRTAGHHLLLLLVTGAAQLAFMYAMQYQWALLPWYLQNPFGQAQEQIWSYEFFFFFGAVAAAHKDQVISALRRYPWRLAVVAGVCLAGALALYGLNLALGQSPAQAANVFQPATLAAFFGAVLGLALLAQHLADTHARRSALWRVLLWAGEISFGIYLSHMVALQIFALSSVQGALGLSQLPAPLLGLAVWILTVAATVALVSVLRYLPFASALTGRPRQPLPPLLRRPTASVGEP